MISLHSRFFQMLIRTVTIKFCLGVGVGSAICVFPQDVLFSVFFFFFFFLNDGLVYVAAYPSAYISFFSSPL